MSNSNDGSPHESSQDGSREQQWLARDCNEGSKQRQWLLSLITVTITVALVSEQLSLVTIVLRTKRLPLSHKYDIQHYC